MLRDLLDITVIVYLDNILIFSKDPNKHPDHVREVLKRLQDNQLFCKPSKCSFLVKKVDYLGIMVSPEGISQEEQKVVTIQEWPRPNTVKQVQAFIGFANFYRRFVPNFSSIVKPLTSLTRKDTKWHWDNKHQHTFEGLKEALAKQPVLAHLDPSKPYILETNASGVAMGCHSPLGLT